MKASALFLRTGVVAGLLGMGLGTWMGLREDFTLSSVHAHINLIGWASMFMFGLYYRMTPLAENRLSLVHYGFAAIGFVLFAGGLALFLSGFPIFGVAWIVGVVCTVVSMALFAWNVFTTTRAHSKAA